jgi:hypothetical protein
VGRPVGNGDRGRSEGRPPETAIKKSGFPAKLSSNIPLEPFVPQMKHSFNERRRAFRRFQGRTEPPPAEPSPELAAAPATAPSPVEASLPAASAAKARWRQASNSLVSVLGALGAAGQRGPVKREFRELGAGGPQASQRAVQPSALQLPLRAPPRAAASLGRPLSESISAKPGAGFAGRSRLTRHVDPRVTKAEAGYREMTLARERARERTYLQVT